MSASVKASSIRRMMPVLSVASTHLQMYCSSPLPSNDLTMLMYLSVMVAVLCPSSCLMK